jgi:hypothetical protein
VCELGIFDRHLQQLEQLPGDLYGMFGRLPVDLRDLGIVFPGAHQAIDALHVVKNRRYGGFPHRLVLAPQLHRATSAHDGFVARDPLGLHGSGRQKHDKQEAEPDCAAAVENASWRLHGCDYAACVKLPAQ